jgi:hypothetical protein
MNEQVPYKIAWKGFGNNLQTNNQHVWTSIADM